ncbi:uncharacterized protein OCT59_001485 [Rhizophagus irregularis]|uniref:uncharacterized protein n=1 Tax=Rhizophagus irregularis TaxID=588596 RepID=UPI00332431E5|nr:hypothetical protein OCT59_001485 [Rhizophagus irregularis]
MLEEADTDLIGFFDELYKGTNPNTKSDKTNNNNKKKLVSLCYFLASINNKYINGIKADIGSYLETSGASASSIDTLANIGLSVSRRTVNRQKTYISEDHQYTVNDYCLQNIENMFILNIDDYHNIHRRNQPTLLKTHDINHFVTILLNSNSNIPKIPYYSLNRIPIHNPKGVDFKLIIDYIDVSFMSKLGKSYYQQNEMWKQYLSDDSYENKLEFLTVHNYDGRVQNQQELRSMKNKSIKTNITSLNKRLFKPLKDNEISEFTEDKGLDEDYDDENIDSLLEQEEYNINNQYEIQYNIWLNYNNIFH